jgi:hypothetical protein
VDRRMSEGLIAEVGASWRRRKARNLEQVGGLGENRQAGLRDAR